VQNIVANRTTLPVLSNILLRADENRLELTATDLDVAISCTVEANVSKKGATTVPAKTFFWHLPRTFRPGNRIGSGREKHLFHPFRRILLPDQWHERG